jgi:hypothetical protein
VSVVLQEKKAIVELPEPLPCVKQTCADSPAYAKSYSPTHKISAERTECRKLRFPANRLLMNDRIEIADKRMALSRNINLNIRDVKRLHTRGNTKARELGFSVRKNLERHGGQIGVESEYAMARLSGSPYRLSAVM